MYENTRAKVISPDIETDLFGKLPGVLQGDTLLPYLFMLVVAYALRMVIDYREEELRYYFKKNRYIGLDILTDPDFADNIAL